MPSQPLEETKASRTVLTMAVMPPPKPPKRKTAISQGTAIKSRFMPQGVGRPGTKCRIIDRAASMAAVMTILLEFIF